MFIINYGKKYFLKQGDLICWENEDLKITTLMSKKMATLIGKKNCLVLGEHKCGVYCFSLSEKRFFVWNKANYKLDNFKVIK